MKERNQIEERFKWDLSEYVTKDNWDELYTKTTSDLQKIKDFNNKLDNKENILKCFKFWEQKSIMLERLFVFARVKIDEDLSVSSSQQNYNKIEAAYDKFSVDASFISPQLLQNSDEFLTDLAKNPEFENYDKIILDLIKERKHTLSEKEENIISQTNTFVGGFKKVFNSFDDGDLKYNKIKDSKGKPLPFDSFLAHKYLISDDRELRKNAFNELNGAFGRYNNFLVQNYFYSVKKDAIHLKIRKFDSALEGALFSQDIYPEIYKMLIESVNNRLGDIQNYYGIKAKALNLNDFAVYDLKMQLGKKNDKKYSYDNAIQTILNAVEPLGNEYVDMIKQAYKKRWIDVLPNKNKNSGAFSWGAYGLHPIVLMNFDDTFRSVSTLAHELGHSMHSFFSDKNNTYFKAGYEIFCAEVASTVNEVLLAEYMLKTEKDKEMLKFFLDDLLGSFHSTVFRQTMFSEFEDLIHKKVEKDEPISGDIINEEYLKLNQKYFGKNVFLPPSIKYEWSRVPHFYRPYYVFAYATGFISAIVIVKNIFENQEKGVKDYFKFLSGGCSKNPAELLKSGGVDLTKQETYDKAFDYLKDLSIRLNKLI